jgi:hypothetical protein
MHSNYFISQISPYYQINKNKKIKLINTTNNIVLNNNLPLIMPISVKWKYSIGKNSNQELLNFDKNKNNNLFNFKSNVNSPKNIDLNNKIDKIHNIVHKNLNKYKNNNNNNIHSLLNKYKLNLKDNNKSYKYLNKNINNLENNKNFEKTIHLFFKKNKEINEKKNKNEKINFDQEQMFITRINWKKNNSNNIINNSENNNIKDYNEKNNYDKVNNLKKLNKYKSNGLEDLLRKLEENKKYINMEQTEIQKLLKHTIDTKKEIQNFSMRTQNKFFSNINL